MRQLQILLLMFIAVFALVPAEIFPVPAKR